MKKAISYILIALQAAFVVGLWILNDLTSKKAGVQHHLQYKRTYYLHHVLTPGVRIALALVVVLIACYLIYKLYKKKCADIMSVLGLIWSVALVVSLLVPSVQETISYPYLLLGLGINLILSLIGRAFRRDDACCEC